MAPLDPSQHLSLKDLIGRASDTCVAMTYRMSRRVKAERARQNLAKRKPPKGMRKMKANPKGSNPDARRFPVYSARKL